MDYLKKCFGCLNISMDELYEGLEQLCCVAQIGHVLGYINRNTTNLREILGMNRKIYPDL